MVRPALARRSSLVTSLHPAGVLLLLLAGGCGTDQFRGALPFLPPDKYVDVGGGRKLTRPELDYNQKVRALAEAVRLNPKDAVAVTSLGELFQMKGNFDEAKRLYLEAIALDASLSQAHYNLGLLEMQESANSMALSHLERAAELSPDDARIRHRIGTAQAALEQDRKALKSYDDALALDNEYTPAYLDKARLLYRQGRYSEAEGVCRQALAHLPKPVTATAKEKEGSVFDLLRPKAADEAEPDTAGAEAAVDLALCLKAQGRLGEALSALPQLPPGSPARADVEVLRSRLEEGLGQRSAAIATLESLRKEFPEMAELPKRLAALYQAEGRTGEAHEQRMAAAELDHSDRTLQIEAVRAAEAAGQLDRVIAVYERLVRLDPEDVASRRALAAAYDKAGIQRQAALTYQKVVAKEPQDLVARRRLGMLYAGLPGFQGSALLQFKAVLEANPRDAEVLRRLGALHLAGKNPTEAEKALLAAIAIEPENAEGHYLLAGLHMQQTRGGEAVKEYQRALELKPDLVEAHLSLAKAYRSVMRLEDALPELKTYLEKRPLDIEARQLYAETLRDVNRREDAAQEYQALVALRPQDLPFTLKLAELTHGLGKGGEAAGMYETLLEKTPSHLEALRAAGRLYDEQKQFYRSMYYWQRVLKLQPGDAEAQSRLADTYRAIGADEVAIEKYEALGQRGNEKGWRSAAELQLKLGRTDQAATDFRHVIELKMDDLPARLELAQILEHSNEFKTREEAVRLYSEVLRLDKEHAQARLNLAILYLETNRLADAQDKYDELLAKEPKHAVAEIGLGVIQRKRGKYPEAADCYQKALIFDPQCAPAAYDLVILFQYYDVNETKANYYLAELKKLGGEPPPKPEPDKTKPDAPLPKPAEKLR